MLPFLITPFLVVFFTPKSTIFTAIFSLTPLGHFRGGARNFRTGELTLPTMGLKYGFQGTINARNLQKIAFHLPTGG